MMMMTMMMMLVSAADQWLLTQSIQRFLYIDIQPTTCGHSCHSSAAFLRPQRENQSNRIVNSTHSRSTNPLCVETARWFQCSLEATRLAVRLRAPSPVCRQYGTAYDCMSDLHASPYR